MKYKYSNNESYEDFSAGRVLYGFKGGTNFPVRLADELFNRCKEYIPKKTEICLYDPCCGSGYLLTTVALINYKYIDTIIGSDIDKGAIEIAIKNLSLLNNLGLEKRNAELSQLYAKYGKESHFDALKSLDNLRLLNRNNSNNIKIQLFQSDALNDSINKLIIKQPDIIICDVPYGDMKVWSESSASVDSLLDNIHNIMKDDTVIAVIHDKSQKIINNKFTKIESIRNGKRVIMIMKKT